MIVTLAVMALLRLAIALMRLLSVRVVGWRRVLALWVCQSPMLIIRMRSARSITDLPLGVCAMALTIRIMRLLLPVRLALWRIALLSSIALRLRAVALLVLIGAIVAIALILAVTLALALAVVVVTGHDAESA